MKNKKITIYSTIIITAAGLIFAFQNFTSLSYTPIKCSDDQRNPTIISITNGGTPNNPIHYKLESTNSNSCYGQIEIKASYVDLDCNNISMWGIPNTNTNFNGETFNLREKITPNSSTEYFRFSSLFDAKRLKADQISLGRPVNSETETKAQLSNLYSPLQVGIDVVSYDNQIKEITIRNCNLHAYKRGIGISNNSSAAQWLWKDLLTNENKKYNNIPFKVFIKNYLAHPEWKTSLHDLLTALRNYDWEQDNLPNEIRKVTPTNVTFENTSITDTVASAIYVDHHVTNTTFKKVRVSKAGGAGLYLEFGSKRTTVTSLGSEGSQFIDTDREGIAIDSSSENIIENTTFGGSRWGGVYLYRNCWEYFREPDISVSEAYQYFLRDKNASEFLDVTANGEALKLNILLDGVKKGGAFRIGRANYFPRTSGSDNNIIRQNFFQGQGENNIGTGIWVASRQSTPINFGNDVNKDGLGCGLGLMVKRNYGRAGNWFGDDPSQPLNTSEDLEKLIQDGKSYMDRDVKPRWYYQDRAKNNKIYGNTFDKIANGLTIEDDGTKVFGNKFESTVASPITIGTPIRSKVKDQGEVRGTRVAFNVFYSPYNFETLMTLKDDSDSALEIVNENNIEHTKSSNINCSNYGRYKKAEIGNSLPDYIKYDKKCTDAYVAIMKGIPEKPETNIFNYFTSAAKTRVYLYYPKLFE